MRVGACVNGLGLVASSCRKVSAAAVAEVIARLFAETGQPPTIEELRKTLDVGSTRTVLRTCRSWRRPASSSAGPARAACASSVSRASAIKQSKSRSWAKRPRAR
ncbi:MAG: DNA-binding protein [Hyphomonadaceae bacterium]|nr:DNA-binding protein [Hyphomonadaceae bacterium]